MGTRPQAFKLMLLQKNEFKNSKTYVSLKTFAVQCLLSLFTFIVSHTGCWLPGGTPQPRYRPTFTFFKGWPGSRVCCLLANISFNNATFHYTQGTWGSFLQPRIKEVEEFQYQSCLSFDLEKHCQTQNRKFKSFKICNFESFGNKFSD